MSEVRGRVLLVGPGLAPDKGLGAFLNGFEREAVPDADRAAVRLAEEQFAAVVFDASATAPAARDALAAAAKERGCALVGLEPAAPLSPAASAPLRRLPWPPPPGFLDQVRSAGVPIVLFVEPALFLSQAAQTALRQSGVRFFQADGPVGLAEMLGGKSALGAVAVIKLSGGLEEAARIEGPLRRVLPKLAAYWVGVGDSAHAASAAIAAGKAALLPRDRLPRLSEVLDRARSAARGRERVLLVDNDLPSLSRLSSALLAAGYEVETTVHGAEALRLAASAPFALAAIGGSALETTELSGAKLALALRERDKDLRIVLMVDQFPVQDALKGVSRAVELGLDDALLKPVDPSRLALSIERALERRFLLLENARLLREVQESARRLAQANAFQSKFFATVAHDVKNPLTAILGYAELLNARLKDRPDALAFAAYIHSAAKTLNLLISDLVDLAAIESGKLRVQIGDLDLTAVIADVASRVAVSAKAKKIQVAVQAAPEIPALRGDPHRIGQVIQNLCTNAVQYTPEGGRVTIEARVSEGRVTVGVRDTGIGIAPEDLPRIWERFFQSKQAQAVRKAGFGLGLKIAREIVQLHGGEMGVESAPGQGSFFYFTLPVPAS